MIFRNNIRSVSIVYPNSFVTFALLLPEKAVVNEKAKPQDFKYIGVIQISIQEIA
jgi:hypothetical protein